MSYPTSVPAQNGSRSIFGYSEQYQLDVSSSSHSALSTRSQTEELKWIKSVLGFLSIPLNKRHLAQNKLTETLNDIVQSQTTLSLTKEIITGELGRQIYDIIPGDTKTKYAQMRVLISYIMTLPTEVVIDLESLNSSENDFQRNLLQIYLELVNLHGSEPSLSTPGSESDNSFKWIDGKDENNNVISFYRKAPNGRHLLFFHHFGNKTIEGYEVKFPYHTYFPIGKFAESVVEIYHTDQTAFGGHENRNEAIKVVKARSGAAVGFTLNVSPFSTTILSLTLDEEKLINPSILPPPPLPCCDIIEYTANFSLERESTLQIPSKVQDQIFSAATAHLKIDDTYTIHFGDAYNITDLNLQELACLYHILNSYLQNKIKTTQDPENVPQIKIFRTITFDILDHCLRIAFADKEKGQLILDELKKYRTDQDIDDIENVEIIVDPNYKIAKETFQELPLNQKTHLQFNEILQAACDNNDFSFARETFQSMPKNLKISITSLTYNRLIQTAVANNDFYFAKNVFWSAPSDLKDIKDPSLAITIATLQNVLNPNFSSVFHRFVSRDTGSDLTSFKTAAIALHAQGQKKSDEPRKLIVWKISLENSNNRVGGLAAVVRASAAAHRKMNQESVYSIHPLYCHEKNPMGQARANIKFQGIIRHEFNGEMLTSSIYKDPVTKEYLIQPDPRYKSMFDIYEPKNVYGGFHFSNRLERYLFVASAAAAAVATYSGKSGLKSVDVVQADAWHAGSPAMELLSQYLNPMRLEQGLEPIEMVYLTHMLMGVELNDEDQIIRNYTEQGEIDSSELSKIGVDIDRFNKKTNLSKRALINSRANIFVSHGVAADAIHSNELLNKGLQASTIAGNLHKVKGITNGIDTAAFDVKNSKSFGKYAVKQDDFFTTQKLLKEDLHKAGIIAHPTKTLAVFIGRYSTEKGIKMLPHVVEQIKKEGGQIVIMGVVPEEGQNSHSVTIVKELLALSKTVEYRDCLKVYMELEEQLDPFILDGDNRGLKKGWAIRQASSIAIVPSFSEACGLVPLEMQCAGALTIAPYHQGLRDMCLPIEAPALSLLEGKPYSFGNGGNAFCYSDCKNIKQLQETIQMAFAQYNSITDDEKNILMKKIHDHALSHNDWVIMKEGLPASGSGYEYSQMYHEVYHAAYHYNGPNKRSEVETFEQALIRRNRTHAALLSSRN